MPHQCTTCGRTFADGSKEMLSGCPDCGGNKFQFRPNGAADPPAEPTPTDGTPSNATPSNATPSNATPSNATPTDDARSSETPAAGTPSTGAQPVDPAGSGSVDAGDPGRPTTEDGAQADARSAVVSEDELAAAAEGVEAAGGPAEPDETADPDLDALRQKLNDQFESIRILSPGTYELNLMELYDREEYIISLREDGRYVIEMPESWDDRE